MSMVGGLDLHRRQITYDVLDVETGEMLARTALAAGSVAVPALAGTGGGDSSTGRVGRARGGGLHGLALRGRGDLGGWLRTVPGRAGRHPGSERTQAPSQDRPHRRPAAAGAAASRGPPRELDPTRRRSSSGESGSGSTSRSSTSGRCGANGSTRCSTTTASRCPKARSARTRPVRCWPSDEVGVSRAQLGSGSTPPTRWSTPPTPRRCRSSTHSSVSAPASRRAERSSTPNTGSAGSSRWCSGPSSATVGDSRRSEQAVRHSGLDVTVDSSDRRTSRRAPLAPGTRDASLGALRGGEELLARRSPDHRYYAKVKERHDGKIAAISVARQLARRSYHVLRAVEPDDRLRHPGLSDALSGSDGACRPQEHQGLERSAPATGVPASIRAGRPSNTDATAPPTRGSPNHDCCRRPA